MEINSIGPFLHYWESVRERTRRVVQRIPPDEIEWSHAPGRFTLGDLVRHLAAIERWMYAETVKGRPSLYAGCRTDLADVSIGKAFESLLSAGSRNGVHNPGEFVVLTRAFVILESMKMEIPVEAPHSGVVRELRVQQGATVREGDVIARLDEAGTRSQD